MSKRQRLLIIDDDRKITQALSVRIGAVGYDVQVVHDGEAGLEAIDRQIPDAIVLDLRMPKLDGFGVLAALRRQERTRHIPVIVLSASAVDEGKSLNAGAFCFLSKPYDPQTLLASIKSALERNAPATALDR